MDLKGAVTLKSALESDLRALTALRRTIALEERDRQRREAERAERRARLPTLVRRRPPKIRFAEFVGPTQPRVFWKGADIMIVNQIVPDYRGSSIVVVSNYASFISHLLRRITKLKLYSVNWLSKVEFYGRIAESMNTLEGETHTRDSLIEAIFNGAEQTLADWLSRVDADTAR